MWFVFTLEINFIVISLSRLRHLAADGSVGFADTEPLNGIYTCW